MHGTSIRIETIRSRDRLLDLEEEWRALAQAAGEPNIFMEPMAALPALDYPDTSSVFATLAWGADAAGRRRLDGMLLLKPWLRSRLAPSAVQTWNYRLRAFGEPLIRRGRERAFWSATLPHLDEMRDFSALRLAQLHHASASTAALREVARDLRRPLYETRRFERAMVRGPVREGSYLEGFPTKMLREQRRRRRLLEDLGEVRFARLGAGEKACAWIDTLLALEASGWKGRKGVASSSEPHVESLVRRVLAEAHAAGRLDMRRLDVGNKTISMIANIHSADSAIAFKMAYDEDYARYSPGVLLQMEYLKEGIDIAWIDSCATPGHPMFESLWRERRPIVTLMVPLDRPGARLACALENAARLLRRAGSRKQE